jgi:hypothetical protein
MGSFSGTRKVLSIEGKSYHASHVAWFYYYEDWPTHEVDHIDGNPWNNAISNLREVSHSTNMFNREGWGKLPKGVAQHSSGRYRSQIGLNGHVIGLGTFDTIEEAHDAYLRAKARIMKKRQEQYNP